MVRPRLLASIGAALDGVDRPLNLETAENRAPGRVRRMFDGIADHYDRLNHLLSLNRDRAWRRRTARSLQLPVGAQVLDLCGGTGDLAIAVAREHPRAEVVCCDFSPRMLAHADQKFRRDELDRCRTIEGDALDLPFDDGAFDAITVGFGVRNFADRTRGLAECRRVLRADGTLAVLEFSHPQVFPLKQLYRIYLNGWLPKIGDRLSGRDGPYGYLARTIGDFPDAPAFATWIRQAGFEHCEWQLLSGGIVALHLAHGRSREPSAGADAARGRGRGRGRRELAATAAKPFASGFELFPNVGDLGVGPIRPLFAVELIPVPVLLVVLVDFWSGHQRVGHRQPTLLQFGQPGLQAIDFGLRLGLRTLELLLGRLALLQDLAGIDRLSGRRGSPARRRRRLVDPAALVGAEHLLQVGRGKRAATLPLDLLATTRRGGRRGQRRHRATVAGPLGNRDLHRALIGVPSLTVGSGLGGTIAALLSRGLSGLLTRSRLLRLLLFGLLLLGPHGRRQHEQDRDQRNLQPALQKTSSRDPSVHRSPRVARGSARD